LSFLLSLFIIFFSSSFPFSLKASYKAIDQEKEMKKEEELKESQKKIEKTIKELEEETELLRQEREMFREKRMKVEEDEGKEKEVKYCFTKEAPLTLPEVLHNPKMLHHWTGLSEATAFEKEFTSIEVFLKAVNFREGTPKKNQRRNWFTEREYFFWFLVRLRRGILEIFS